MKRLKLNRAIILKALGFITIALFIGYNGFGFFFGQNRYYREIKNISVSSLSSELLLKDFSAASQFQNALFIGDSFTLALDNYGYLENNEFLAGIGYTSYDHVNYTYFPEDLNPKRIFILLGINDLVQGYSPDEFIENYRELLHVSKEIYPDAKIYVQSIAPVTASFEYIYEDRGNDQINEFNQMLKKLCQKERIVMLNPWNAAKEESGALAENLSSDGLHLNDQGHLLWLEQLVIWLK